METKTKNIKLFFSDIWGWLRSLFIIVFRSIKKPATFYGYKAFFWASVYAKKRTKLWKSWWDQSGKQQGVIPFDDTRLIVCSKLELKWYKKRKLLSAKSKPRKIIKNAYLKTEL